MRSCWAGALRPAYLMVIRLPVQNAEPEVSANRQRRRSGRPPGGPVLRNLRRLKNALVPKGPRLRRLPLGIGRGLRLQLDLHYRTGLYLGLYEVELNRHLRE